MKKNISTKMMLAMMAVICMCVTACGGNDDEDSPGGGGSTTVGVHRIDVQIDGKTNSNWVSAFTFYGLKPDGTFTGLYENGKALPIDPQFNTWSTEEIRDFSIGTDKNAVAIVGGIVLGAPGGSKATEDVIITMVGYVNNNRVYTRVFTLPAGKSAIGISFSTDEGGKSGYSIDGNVTQ
ncbi:MAG: hypothetical protein IJQ60_15630 [Prevotella sp.]|nr:hypothetical protein [Prevotella sp.]